MGIMCYYSFEYDYSKKFLDLQERFYLAEKENQKKGA